MPSTTHRNPDINLPSTHMRPGATTDSLGNEIANGPDVAVTTTNATGACLSAVIPSTLRRTPYVILSGAQTGDINMRRWLVAVIGAPTLKEGDAVVVASGPQQGKYRCQVVNPTPPGEQIVLAQCLKE